MWKTGVPLTATTVDIEASYKSLPVISYGKYDQAYTSTQKHNWKLWARCRRRISCIRRRDRDSKETYWKAPDTQNVQDVTETVMEERAVEEIPPNTWEKVLWCLSTETWSNRRVKQPYWKSTAVRGDKTVTPRSWKWSRRFRRRRKFVRGQLKGWPNGIHKWITRSDEPSNWPIA